MCLCTLLRFLKKSMEKTLDNLERQIDLLARGLYNLRDIVQLLEKRRGSLQ